MNTYSVFGCWPATQERYAGAVEASDPRSAEIVLQRHSREYGSSFWVCAVLDGQVPTADNYTIYVDPRDRRHEPMFLDAPLDEPEATTFTVFGIVRNSWEPINGDPGSRYTDQVIALSAFDAEDIARNRVLEEGVDCELWVCAVVQGEAYRSDRYATFVDPSRHKPL